MEIKRINGMIDECQNILKSSRRIDYLLLSDI